jgi:hypothetical protein
LPGEFEGTNHEALRSLDVLDPGKAVVRLSEADSFSLHLSSEPFATVHDDLERVGHPGLQAGMDEPEVGVDEVAVDVLTHSVAEVEDDALLLSRTVNVPDLA